MAYGEQAATKIQMGLLDRLTPMTADYLDKLEHIRGGVSHHVYEEEGNWSLDLKQKATASEQIQITRRYEEEFMPYVGNEGGRGDVTLRTVPEIPADAKRIWKAA